MQQEEDVVFRSTPQYWLIHFLPVFMIYILIPIILIIIFGMLYSLIFLGTSVFAILFYREEFSTALSAQVKINRQGISLLYHDEETFIRWAEIRYIEAVHQGSSRGITVYCHQQAIRIPGRFFDFDSLYSLIRAHLPEEACHPLAYQAQPEYQEWKAQMSEKFDGLTRLIKVDTGQTGRFIGILLIAVGIFLLYAVLSKNNPNRGIGAIFALVFAGCGFLLIFFSRKWLAANPEKIIQYQNFTRLEIRWDDISRVEQNPNTGQWVLYDRSTCLAIPSPVLWSGRDKRLLRSYIDYRMHLLPVVVEENTLAFLRYSKKMAGS
jgi:hypothetical protein